MEAKRCERGTLEELVQRANGEGALWQRTNPLKVVHYLLLGDALGLVLVHALGFVLVDALGVVHVDQLIVRNPSCNKLKNYSSINLWIAAAHYQSSFGGVRGSSSGFFLNNVTNIFQICHCC